MYEQVHEKIKTDVVFTGFGKPNIRMFEWQHKRYIVKEVTLSMKARKGRELVWLFCVATDKEVFKLRFDTDTLQWFMEETSWKADSSLGS